MTQSHEARCSVGVETLSAGISALIRSSRIEYALALIESANFEICDYYLDILELLTSEDNQDYCTKDALVDLGKLINAIALKQGQRSV